MQELMKNVENKKIITFGLSVLFLPILILFFIIFFSNNFFTYTLDDPYIHLELAKNFANGNYGINMEEFSAPSSTILWTFLLAPFSYFEFYIFVPLILNSVFLILTAFLLIIFFRDTFNNIKQGILAAFLLLFSINAYGLVYTGMEHSLHLLLTVFTTICLLHANWIKNYKFLFYASIVLAPLVRYEGMAISLPVLIYIFMSQPLERKNCILSFFIMIASISGFSFYLYSNLGEILPSSVMAKQHSTSGGGVRSIVVNIYSNLTIYGWLFCLAFAIFTLNNKRNYIFILFTAFSIVLYAAFGKYGWFGRYEVFFIAFISILLINNLYQIFRFKSQHIYLFFLIPFMFSSLVYTTLRVPLASSNIYNQQYLISQFVKKINKPVAVNDLGLVSYYSDNYVLDLWGLGNHEALLARKNKKIDYISTLTKKYNTEILIIYSDWFSAEELSKFIHVADLHLIEKRITPASSKVSFYVSDEKLISVLKDELLNFDFEENLLDIQY